MTIQLLRSGGFAGLKREIMIESSTLAWEIRQELHAAIHKADFFNLPASLPAPKSGADYFQYQLTVQDGNHQHTVVFTDQALPPVLSKLTDMIIALQQTLAKPD